MSKRATRDCFHRRNIFASWQPVRHSSLDTHSSNELREAHERRFSHPIPLLMWRPVRRLPWTPALFLRSLVRCDELRHRAPEIAAARVSARARRTALELVSFSSSVIAKCMVGDSHRERTFWADRARGRCRCHPPRQQRGSVPASDFQVLPNDVSRNPSGRFCLKKGLSRAAIHDDRNVHRHLAKSASAGSPPPHPPARIFQVRIRAFPFPDRAVSTRFPG